jgi:benzodiazapine receptor
MKSPLLLSTLAVALTPSAALRAPPRGITSHATRMPPLVHSVRYGNAALRMEADASPVTDWVQLAKYPVATLGEFGIISALFCGLDAIVTLPTFLVPPLFFFLSLRSRIFSILPAQRPNRQKQEGKANPTDVKTPSWTPPGIAFPFIWLTISCLRAASSTVIWRASGCALFSPPLLVLVLHLCIGDTWNCITNIERRKGTAALGVLAVLASVYAAVYTYGRTVTLAGALLAPSAVWISIASVLTWTIWSMNGKEPLLPQKGDGKAAPLRLPLSDLFEA